jgi:hypothetical protein
MPVGVVISFLHRLPIRLWSGFSHVCGIGFFLCVFNGVTFMIWETLFERPKWLSQWL